jgi:protein-S-isoprenylcysteine O-methyltransferase Ste14
MIAILQNPLYWLALANLASFAYIFAALTSPALKQQFFRLPAWAQKGLVAVNVGTAWAMAFLPQQRLVSTAPALLPVLGGVLMLLAVGVWAGALLKIGVIPSIKAKESVIASGVYGLVRHPIYLANLLFPLGLFLALRAGAALAYLPVLFLFYAALTVVEEASLLDEYGQEYVHYQSSVRCRLIPFLF